MSDVAAVEEELAGDQAAELAALEAAAQGGPGAPPAVAEEQAASPQQESRIMWGMVFAMIDGAGAGALYPTEKREQIIALWPDLCAQEGWEVNALGGKWGLRITFAMVALPGPVIQGLIAMVMAKLKGRQPVTVDAEGQDKKSGEVAQ
jgi:hypothetical protein